MLHPPTGHGGDTGARRDSEVENSDGDDEEYNPRADAAKYSMRTKPRK